MNKHNKVRVKLTLLHLFMLFNFKTIVQMFKTNNTTIQV